MSRAISRDAKLIKRLHLELTTRCRLVCFLSRISNVIKVSWYDHDGQGGPVLVPS